MVVYETISINIFAVICQNCPYNTLLRSRNYFQEPNAFVSRTEKQGDQVVDIYLDNPINGDLLFGKETD